MNASTIYEHVRASRFATELTDDECEVLVKILELKTLEDGEILIYDGAIDNSLHVIIDGKIAVVKDAGGGEEELLHTLKTGDIAGAMGFIDGTEHSATLRSVGRAEVYKLERDKLEALLTTHPVIVYRVMRSIVRSIHSIVRRMNNQYVQMTNYITKHRGRY